MKPLAVPTQAPQRQPSSEQQPAWTSRGLDQRIIRSMVYDDPVLARELSERGSSDASMRAHASSLGVTDAFIKECRLSGSRPALRNCIKCEALFLSSGIHNRLCRRCPAR